MLLTLINSAPIDSEIRFPQLKNVNTRKNSGHLYEEGLTMMLKQGTEAMQYNEQNSISKIGTPLMSTKNLWHISPLDQN